MLGCPGRTGVAGSQPLRPDPLLPAIIASRPNRYTGSRLDRAAHRREDAEWIAAALADPASLWVPVWRGRHLVASGRAVLLPTATATALRDPAAAWAFLGLLDGTPVLAFDLGGGDDPLAALDAPPEEWDFAELRAVVALLPADEAALLAHARGLLHWRARHRFCGHCGAPLAPRGGGNVMQCDACGSQHFPRTDPAVIMLVLCGDKALLAHARRFPVPTMYSTLAGFVEPGESLEEAVAREVFEEAGVRVGRVHYHSSQPWPFPASLMIGFHAEASDPRIVLDDDELTDARWFTRAQVRAPAAHGFTIPGPDSIARRLIDDWVES